LISDESTDEWLVLPVTVKVVIAANAAALFVEYVQVAASLVVTDNVVWLVPAARFVDGAVMVTVGAVVSAAGVTGGVTGGGLPPPEAGGVLPPPPPPPLAGNGV
jgi:hypothetical protein